MTHEINKKEEFNIVSNDKIISDEEIKKLKKIENIRVSKAKYYLKNKAIIAEKSKIYRTINYDILRVKRFGDFENIYFDNIKL
jgi:hypothetical protein